MSVRQPRVPIADDKEIVRSLLATAFADKGYHLSFASDGAEAIAHLKSSYTDLVITDLKMPDQVGNSAHTQQVLQLIQKVGPSKSTVLITEPRGTGKERVARALHEASPLKNNTFVALNCALLAPGIRESELFVRETCGNWKTSRSLLEIPQIWSYEKIPV